MFFKSLKIGAIAVAGLVLLGGFVFGTDLVSYARTSASSVRGAMKEKVPVEFELQRARDLIDEILPEVHANIRRVAQEEVELAALRSDIAESETAIEEQRQQLARLRKKLQADETSYEIGGRTYSRDRLRTELERRLEHVKEAELMLESKRRMLTAREEALAGATQKLEQAQMRKARLEEKVETLAAQHRLVEASSQGTDVALNEDKMAQTERLLGDIQKRLDVAERVMAREAVFTDELAVGEPLNEPELLADVDAYLKAHGEAGEAGAMAERGE